MSGRRVGIAVGVVALVASLVGVPSTGGATATARTHADRVAAHDVASFVGGRGGARATSVPAPKTISVTCYSYPHTDPKGDTSAGLDVITYVLSYDCIHHQWQLTLTFAAPVPDSRIAFVRMDMDADGNSTNGCDGFEHYVALGYVSGALHAGFGALNGNCDPTFQRNVHIDRAAGSNKVDVVFADSGVGESFYWGVFGTGNTSSNPATWEFLPNGTSALKATGSGSTGFTSATVPSVSGTYAPVSGDFNGDGYSDVIWYGASGASAKWLGGPSGFTGSSLALPANRTKVFAGDFDGDGYSDLFLYTAGTTVDSIMWGTATGFAPVTTSYGVNANYQAIVGDFNGDGTDDITWYAPGTVPDAVWFFSPTTRGAITGLVRTINGNYHVSAGDFNGDGYCDLLFWQPGSGTDAMWLGTAFGVFSTLTETINGLYATSTTGDFNGDGFTDVLFYTPDTAADALALGSAAAPYFKAGPPTVINEHYTTILPGDFNGNGADDVLLYAAGAVPERLWSAPTPQSALPFGTVDLITVDPTFDRVYVLQSEGSNQHFVVVDGIGTLLDDFDLGALASGGRRVVWSSDTVYVVASQSKIERFDRATLAHLSPIDISAHPLEASAAFAGGRLWWTSSNAFTSFDPSSGVVTASNITADTVASYMASASAPNRLLLRGISTLSLYDVAGATPVLLARVSANAAVGGAAWLGDATQVLAQTDATTIASLDPATLAPTGLSYTSLHAMLPFSPLAVSSGSGRWLLAASGVGVEVFRLGTGAEHAYISLGSTPSGVAVSRDDRLAYVVVPGNGPFPVLERIPLH